MTAFASRSAPAAHAGPGWVDAATSAARRLAVITAAGVVLGVLVGGVGGRLAMMLLAATNPGMGGLTSDDGFMIGRFTLLGSLNLLLVGGLLGALGALVYAALRGLLVGPAWFRALSIGLGPAVVVGEHWCTPTASTTACSATPGWGSGSSC